MTPRAKDSIPSSTRSVDRAQLGDIILRALQATEGCPQRGFEVTVYGSRPWNALLRITPLAGAPDAAAWRARLETMVLLFREQYELKEDVGDNEPATAADAG
jgi:hypothetical protein